MLILADLLWWKLRRKNFCRFDAILICLHFYHNSSYCLADVRVSNLQRVQVRILSNHQREKNALDPVFCGILSQNTRPSFLRFSNHGGILILLNPLPWRLSNISGKRERCPKSNILTRRVQYGHIRKVI